MKSQPVDHQESPLGFFFFFFNSILFIYLFIYFISWRLITLQYRFVFNGTVLFRVFLCFQSKPQSPKRIASLLPINSGSKENGIHEEQDQEPQDLFAGKYGLKT